jgi:LysM repeat protein
MSTPNPLVPHGSNLEQAARSKSTLSIAAFIVGAHAAVFLGLLLIGCRRENNEPGADLSAATNSIDSAIQPGALPGDTNVTALPTGTNGVDTAYGQPITYPGGYGAAPTNNPGYQPGYAGQPAVQGDPYAQPVLPPTTIAPETASPSYSQSAATAGSGYKVKRGDIAYNIAKKNGISLKALKDANPGVDLAKLKDGQTINVPGAAPSLGTTPATSRTETAATGMSSDSLTTYTVKSGDTLTKIAKKYGTTVKAIRKASGLSSDVIKAGQKLKVPTKAAAQAAPQAAPATPEPAYTAPAQPGYNPPAYSPQPGAPR